MYTANKIAEWFLAFNRMKMHDEDSDYISNLKLQKLVYYAQGTYFAETGSRLFDDAILAWQHGPVVESLYQEYKHNGAQGIEFTKEFNFDDFDTETQTILEDVYNVFGKFSAWGLREMSHGETPWQETKQGEEINVNSIRDYFKENYIV